MRLAKLLALPLAAVAAAGQPVAAAGAEPVAGSAAPVLPSVQIDIEPGADSGQFQVSARVFDLGSRRVLATPQLVIQQGVPSSTEVHGPDGSFTVRIEAGVDPTGTSAQWSYTIIEQGVVIADSRGTVTLSRPRQAGY